MGVTLVIIQLRPYATTTMSNLPGFPQKTNDDLQEIIRRNQSGSQVNDELQKSPFDTVYFRYLTEFSELRAMS